MVFFFFFTKPTNPLKLTQWRIEFEILRRVHSKNQTIKKENGLNNKRIKYDFKKIIGVRRPPEVYMNE